MKTQTERQRQRQRLQLSVDCVQSVAGVHQQPQHALFGRRTHLYMAMAMPPSPSPSRSPSGVSLGAPHARIVARPRPRPWPLSSRHLSHASISDLRARSAQFQCLLGSALLWSGLVWSAACLHVDSTRIRKQNECGPRSRSIFMANWQLALNFSSSFIVYAFTYAPQTCSWPSAPSPALPLPVALGTFPF